MFYVTSENCYISVRIFVELLIKFVFMPSVLWSVQIYRLLQTKHDGMYRQRQTAFMFYLHHVKGKCSKFHEYQYSFHIQAYGSKYW